MAAQFASIIQSADESTGESTGESTLEIRRIRSELVHHTIGHRIFHYRSVASTMPIAHDLAKDSAIRSGTLIVAEEQSAGRGRLERRWQAPPNSSLLMSLLLRGDLLPSQPATLMMIAGIAAIDAITQSMPTLAGKCGLKWPNDIVLGDRETSFKKVGGVLIESQFSSGRLAYGVVGMGLNVQQRAEQLPQIHNGGVQATSLAAFTGTEWNRSTLLVAIARSWEQLLQQSRTDESAVLQRWQEHLWTLGQQVVVTQAASVTQTTSATGSAGTIVCEGLALGVEADGALIVGDAEGAHHSVYAGDVSLRSGVVE